MPKLQGWADLPEDLLHSIVPLLSSFLDILAFAGTCCSWHTAFTSYPSKSTLRALLPPLLIRPNVHVSAPHLPSSRHGLKLHTCQLIDPSNPNISLHCQIPQLILRKQHFVGSSNGQLIYGCHRKYSILDVFTGAEISPPELSSSEDTDIYCGMLTTPLSSVTSPHLLLFAQSNMPCDQFSLFDWPVGSNSWTELQLGKTQIEQIVDFNGQFIAMDGDDRLYVLHLAPRLRIQDLETICCPFMLTSCWLVACGDMLLMVGDEFSLIQKHDIAVGAYHLDMSSKPARWVEMRKLENYALYLGDDTRTQPFSCINRGRWGGRSNCLYRASHNQTWTLQGLLLCSLGTATMSSRPYGCTRACSIDGELSHCYAMTC